ncbi:uncharacterized protein BP01DRAFT_401151 [Aspergillus saccharolyticus JOP 1030-1]|uniref:LysM domain-containing protein n=1 Tax=Aspergillus saccharolyticus JOP 1030-1 TaxID=1450539 RepID=A0A319AC23_9EURO|nr:hypothetical protein BP01DRAFT_401151 [Aspergillus saccharolyticus JOP 1030-1]PYH44462.1 hypothetical protein BP01DRAFT_401151 [Aspergillus saccharolyticus JOP 1030-1]
MKCSISNSHLKYSHGASAACTTSYLYDITEETTVFDIARKTNRGVCDIVRQNPMADVTIPPNIGKVFIIPGETCTPDNSTCLIQDADVHLRRAASVLHRQRRHDTYETIALRLNITTEPCAKGSFLEVPECPPSQCITKPFSLSWGVYKYLADQYRTTVGQIMRLSRTGGTFPSIDLPMNCTALSNILPC